MLDWLRRPAFPLAVAAIMLTAAIAIPLLDTDAQQPATDDFARTWERTDQPVADLAVNRTWIWGPLSTSAGIMETYAEASGGQRLVQYYDKARMEVPHDPEVGPESPWYVTTGLLPIELMTGRLQLGDDAFEQHAPARINVAGDPTGDDAPTYADMAGLMNAPARPAGQVIVGTVDGNGLAGSDDRFASYGVTAAYAVPETGHSVASVFWDFMNSSGTISVNGELTSGPLFQDPFFGFGFPVTEAYWTTIELEGEPTDALVQVFERRVATYTPDNPEGWRVETGNTGLHYYQWRYELIPGDGAPPAATETPHPTASATATTPPGEPTPTEEPREPCMACLEYGLGEIGMAGPGPLGEDAFSPLSQPYLAVPEAPVDVIDEVVIGTSGSARLNFPKSIPLVVDWSPSGKIYFVADFNDGSVLVTDLWDAHYGDFVTHTWVGRGEFHVKIWAIDPQALVRTAIAELTITVE
jgi:hypothetical protein